jgi:hypothetical protein
MRLKRMVKKANDMGPQPNVDWPILAKRITFSSLDFYLRLLCQRCHSHKGFRKLLFRVLGVLRVLLQVFRRQDHQLLDNMLPQLRHQDFPVLLFLGKAPDLVLLQECLLHRRDLVSMGGKSESLEAFGRMAFAFCMILLFWQPKTEIPVV